MLEYVQTMVLLKVTGLERIGDVIRVLSCAQCTKQQYRGEVEVHDERVAEETKSGWIWTVVVDGYSLYCPMHVPTHDVVVAKAFVGSSHMHYQTLLLLGTQAKVAACSCSIHHDTSSSTLSASLYFHAGTTSSRNYVSTQQRYQRN